MLFTIFATKKFLWFALPQPSTFEKYMEDLSSSHQLQSCCFFFVVFYGFITATTFVNFHCKRILWLFFLPQPLKL
jgi:hypothetical protein